MRLYYFTSAQFALEAVRHQRYKLSTYDNLNDPFELFAPDLSDETVRAAFRQFKRKCATEIAMLCCSKSWGNTLLWSHYADRHTGIALVLEVADECVTHVRYRKTRRALSLGEMDREMRTKGISAISKESLQVKAYEWGYEDEARIFFGIGHLPPPNDGLYFCPFDERISLQGLILGPLCQTSLNDIRRSMPGDIRLQIRKSRIAFGSFKVVRDKSQSPVWLNSFDEKKQ